MKLLGTILLRFLAGLVTVPLATVFGLFVFGFLINLIWYGLSEDKNVGLGTALEGAFVGIVLALAGLAWFSIRHHNGMPLWGGLAVAGAEYLWLHAAIHGPVPVLSEFLWPILLVVIVGAFVLGVALNLIFLQQPTNTKAI
jgi:hypothetical protein